MKLRIRGAALLAVAILIPFSIQEAAGQAAGDPIVVEGSVFDVQHGRGIPQARIQIFPADVEDFEAGASVTEFLTSQGGAFRSGPIPLGQYRIRVTALGYRDFVEDVSLERPPTLSLTIRLAPQAMELDPVMVEGIRSQRLDDWGFYERRERGSAATFTRQEIEQRNPTRISDMLRTVAGVRLNDPGQGRGPPFLLFRGTCRPDIIIDAVNLGNDVRLDEVVVPTDIEGIEVHRGMGGPMEYTLGCGSVVVWTADPTSRLDEVRNRDILSIRSYVAAAVFVTLSLLVGR
jgi:hypothetical protein